MKTGLALIAVAAAASGMLATVPSNVTFDALTKSGVQLTDGTKIAVPLPSMPDGAKAEREREVIQSVAETRPFAQFVRNSRVAPFALKMESLANKDGRRTGQAVALWFVAHGDLDVMERERLFDDLFRLGASDSDDRQLTESELADRHIKPLPSLPGFEQRFSILNTQLLDKVQLNGVMQMVTTRSDQCVLAAFLLDPQFTNDEMFSNRWRSISRSQSGKTLLGDPVAYQGFGGYLKATTLASVKGAVFVELHMVFNEPEGWFGGHNLLRSKLPLLMQENVRRFRSRLLSMKE
jgi:hypothetical protein